MGRALGAVLEALGTPAPHGWGRRGSLAVVFPTKRVSTGTGQAWLRLDPEGLVSLPARASPDLRVYLPSGEEGTGSIRLLGHLLGTTPVCLVHLRLASVEWRCLPAPHMPSSCADSREARRPLPCLVVICQVELGDVEQDQRCPKSQTPFPQSLLSRETGPERAGCPGGHRAVHGGWEAPHSALGPQWASTGDPGSLGELVSHLTSGLSSLTHTAGRTAATPPRSQPQGPCVRHRGGVPVPSDGSTRPGDP